MPVARAKGRYHRFAKQILSPYGGHRLTRLNLYPPSGLACSLGLMFFLQGLQVCIHAFICKFAIWHVSRGTNRFAIGTIVFLPFRCVEWCLLRPDRPSRLCSRCQDAWTDRETHTQTPLSQVFFQRPTKRKSSIMISLMLKH